MDYSKHIKHVTDEEPSESAAQAPADDVAVRPDMVESVNAPIPEQAESGMVTTVKRLFGGDRVLWVIIIALMIISVLVVYSSTAKMAYMPNSGSSPAEFLQKQLWLLGLCVVIMLGVHRLSSKVFGILATPAFYLSIGLTLLAYVIGRTTNGAARWIPIGSFQLQPSEILKVTIIMYLARQLALKQNIISTLQIVPSLKFWNWGSPKQRRIWREGAWPIFFPIVLSCLVIFPAHTSSAVLVFAMSLVMLYIGRVSWREIFRIIKWALVGVALVAVLGLGRSDTAKGRISTWVDLWTTDRTEIPAEELSDTERSMIAIRNGGILGRGAGQSTVRVEMTHPESDYAFAFFVEEYGIGLAIILIALYVWIFFRAIEIFEKCPKKFPALLSLGLALLITGQALLHIMVTVNIIPETGQTLPLISRGGSSLLFTSAALGMILSVSRQNIENSYRAEEA